jgi:hypothetical protein
VKFAPHLYAAPVILGDLLGYRQTQTQALGRPGFFRAVETLEYVWDLVLGYRLTYREAREPPYHV